MNRRHAAKIAQLTATVHRLHELNAPITVLAIEDRRAAGQITATDEQGFTIRVAHGDEHKIPFAELESVGTYNP